MAKNPDIPISSIAGVPVAALSMKQLAERMVEDCTSAAGTRRPQLVFDINGQALSMRETNAEFRAALEAADLIHADGGFIVAVSRIKGKTPIPERSATTDFIWTAAAHAEATGLSFFLLGGEPGLAERAGAKLAARHPDLMIAGTASGFFDPEATDGVIDMVNRSGADVLWLGLGKPLEQAFAARIREKLDVGWIVTCGGCFNFVTGDYRRAPKWMQQSGLEWLHRMASRPRSLFMRYLLTNPHALYLALTR